jgi:hypothetical protein
LQIGYLKNRCFPESKLYEYNVENDTPDTSAVLPNGHSTTGAGVNGISAADKTNSSFPEDTSHEPLLARSGNFELSFLDELFRRFFPSNFL